MKIFINGFGRIGRTILRQVLQSGDSIEIVGINDIASLDSCVYLFRYDSVFGPFAGEVVGTDGALQVDGTRIPFTNAPDISGLDLTGVDLVLECTGTAKTREVAKRGLTAGARAVLISGPSDAADRTVVLGANDAALGDARIVSNASCTTNAIAPLLSVLDARLGIERGHITTIHCYTGSQPTVDMPGPSFERSRAAAVSMVPTSTSAAGQIAHILPDMQDRLSVTAVRVPCISVSAVDATFQLRRLPDDPIDMFLRDAVEATGVMHATDDACVSTDMRARPESLVLALRETQVIQPAQLRVFGWYDNEWGFSARMIDMARRMVARP
ncbi:type I glyceraldehyde-3-phosphate dehydrogenase [Tateyamaria sp. SN6-1]|uniref:type I glyceraldehyde-3-phosphate dehydrogenase n=1 Tax=Tateyamaria sp. SN6-1 TaxID=3092148 RepID=UPI0039F61D08